MHSSRRYSHPTAIHGCFQSIRRNSRLKSPLGSILSSFYQDDQLHTSLLVLLRDVTRLTPQTFKWLPQLKLHKTYIHILPLYFCCCERGAHQLWRHKIQFQQFSEVSTNSTRVPFVKRRKMTVFNVEDLSGSLTKSCKTLNYDYLD